MGRFRSLSLRLAVAILPFSAIMAFLGCGGGAKAGPPLFTGHINLNPSSATSVVLGGTLNFSATVQTASGTTLNTTVTYSSSDTSILNLSANGVACAGHWDVGFTTCTPGATGPVIVTATALGGTSSPTVVFIHPPIDNITVTGILTKGVQVQEPCLSQTQSMTVEAHAYSQGADITASVGPFTWSANNPSVVSLVPLVNPIYVPGISTVFNFATNQATATANTPGITYIYASANGVSSGSFQQPQLTNSQGTPSPVLDFFSTCPVQNIALELGAAGSGQTTFSVAKGSSNSQTVIATVADIMGYTSLPRSDGGLVLSKIPLTWSSSQPGSIGTGTTGCTLSCGLSIAAPGSATITASCSPPTCNVGFPTVPDVFTTNGVLDNGKITACTSYFQALYPQFPGCQELIPVPVYASSQFVNPPNPPQSFSPTGAISGVVTGSTSAPAVLATSTGCKDVHPSDCSTSAYYVTSTTSAGSGTALPVSPNSFLFDPTGARVWMGSNFGAEIVNPGSFGGSSSPFTSLGTVTGKVLATSSNGTTAVFSDTIHTPNQVYIVSTGSSTPTALNIPSATMAAFSPDGLKTFIVGNGGTSLYIYSPLQALQGPFTLAGPAKAITFSPNGAFTFIAEGAPNGGSASLAAYANCNNQPVVSISLPADPIVMKVLPALPRGSKDSSGNPIPPNPIPPNEVNPPDDIHVLILDSTGFDIATSVLLPPTSPASLCPQVLTFTNYANQPAVQRIELNQGTLQPLNFFHSADDTQLYIVNMGSSSIIVYNFIMASVIGGIQLQNNATPLTADMSVDSGTIVITGSDGLLHEVTTAVGGNDLTPISFPDIPNFPNPFCSFIPGTPCALGVAIVKP